MRAERASQGEARERGAGFASAPLQEGERMKVEQVPLGTLKPYDNNAKKHTEEQLEAVKNSIREFGFRNPVIAWHDQDGRAEIVAGHARCKAAQELGMDEVPVVFCDDLTDAQRRALTLVDNQTTMMTGWDEDALAYELDVLSGDFDMADFGFDLGAAEDFAMPDDSPLEDDGVTVVAKFADVDGYRAAIDAITEAVQANGGEVSIR